MFHRLTSSRTVYVLLCLQQQHSIYTVYSCCLRGTSRTNLQVLVHVLVLGPQALVFVLGPQSPRKSRTSHSANSPLCMITFHVPLTRRQLGNRAFSVAGPTAWNSLPQDIRTAPTPSTFKNLLKTHLFSLSYNIIVTVGNLALATCWRLTLYGTHTDMLRRLIVVLLLLLLMLWLSIVRTRKR